MKPTEAVISKAGEARFWLAHSRPGERAVYHFGFLAKDRVWLPNGVVWNGADLPVDHPAWEDWRRVGEIDRVAAVMAQAAEAGTVALVQQKMSPMYYRYVAVRTRRA